VITLQLAEHVDTSIGVIRKQYRLRN